MMEIENVKDLFSLRDYLRDQPVEVSQGIACWSALTVLPLTFSWQPTAEKDQTLQRDLIFQTFRATQISWAAAVGPAHDIWKPAANAADAAAYAAADAAANAAAYAASIDLWHEIRKALEAISTGGVPAAVKAVASGPRPFDGLWQGMKQDLLAEDPNWAFWLNWHNARLLGEEETDFAIYIRVAELTEKEWAKGYKAVNAKIAGWLKSSEGPHIPTIESLGANRQAALADQVNWIIQSPTAHRNEVDRIHRELSFCISAYLKAEQLNQLPDDLAFFNDIEATLSKILATLRLPEFDDEAQYDLKHYVLELEAENKLLKEKLASNGFKGRIGKFLDAYSEEFGKEAAKASKWIVVGGSTMVAGRYLGPETIEAIAEQFEEVCKLSDGLTGKRGK
ncbi:MAG: hypothetical protein AAF393_12825 [Pseudomonadota bacterium]